MRGRDPSSECRKAPLQLNVLGPSFFLASGHELYLYDTVYVPSSRRSLVSTSILDRQGYSFWQGSGKIDIYHNSVIVGTANLVNGLYCLNFNTVLESSSVSASDTAVGKKRQKRNESSSMLWHRRLGHISRARLERMVKQGILHDLDFSDFDSCVDCIKGKFPSKARN